MVNCMVVVTRPMVKMRDAELLLAGRENVPLVICAVGVLPDGEATVGVDTVTMKLPPVVVRVSPVNCSIAA